MKYVFFIFFVTLLRKFVRKNNIIRRIENFSTKIVFKYRIYAYLVLVDVELFRDFSFAFNNLVRKLLRLLRSKKDFFIFLSKWKNIVAIRKLCPKKPRKYIFYDFLRFIIHNNCIFNYVIIFFCSLGGRPNSCFHNWAHESQFLFFFLLFSFCFIFLRGAQMLCHQIFVPLFNPNFPFLTQNFLI